MNGVFDVTCILVALLVAGVRRGGLAEDIKSAESSYEATAVYYI